VAIVIRANGVDITARCDLNRTTFTMNAGPIPGTAKVWVRDLDHTSSFSAGKELTCDIDGLRVWGGFVMGIGRHFAFDVDDTSDPASTPRYLILEGADYNLLFSKRFVLNKADPISPMTPFAEATHDDTIIADLVSNFLDLTGDGITTSGVLNVGTPLEDGPGVPFEPPNSWGDAMRRIALMPGAIYYISPEKVLNYADVDIPDAPFGLSDDPNHSTTFGYSDFSLLRDGTQLANDAFVWGAAIGVDHMTFARKTDAASVTEHGLWQWADYRQDLYRPASVQKRADSYVDGSTQNNRGHKNDAISVRLKTFKPGLQAGMKVHVYSTGHGWDDVIPIRSMTINFVNPTTAHYELYLAHFLDEAWNTAEFKNDEPDDQHNKTRLCGTPTWLDCSGGGGGTGDCGITDTWDRPDIDPGWGIADCAAPWFIQYDGFSFGGGYLSDGEGFLQSITSHSCSAHMPISLGAIDAQVEFVTDRDGTSGIAATANPIQAALGAKGGSSASLAEVQVKLVFTLSAWHYYIQLAVGSVLQVFELPFAVSAGVRYHLRLNVVPGGPVQGRIWQDGTAEPGTWYESTATTPTGTTFTDLYLANYGGGSTGNPLQTRFNNLDVAGVNICTATTRRKFDEFNRVVSSGWGTSDAGFPWTSHGIVTTSVDGSAGLAHITASDSMDFDIINSTGPWGAAGGFLMRARFSLSQIYSYDPGNMDTATDTSIFFDFDSLGVYLDIDNGPDSSRGFIQLDTQTATRFAKKDWLANTPYILELEFRPSTIYRARIYVDGTIPPAWQSIASTASSTSPGSIRVHSDVTFDDPASTFDFAIDWLDFDSTLGGGGGCALVDTFTRVVAPNAWGVSDSGVPWSVNDGIHHSAVIEVADGVGVLIDEAAFNTVTAGLLDPNHLPMPLDIMVDVSMTNIPSTGGQLRINVGGDNSALALDLHPATGDALIQNGDFSTGVEEIFTPLNVPLTIRLAKVLSGTGTILSAKIWPVGMPEPANWMISDQSAQNRDTYSVFDFELSQQSVNSNFTLAVDNIRCSNSGGTSSDPNCVDSPPLGTYVTAQPYLPGTLDVEIFDGNVLVPITVAESDPSRGLFFYDNGGVNVADMLFACIDVNAARAPADPTPPPTTPASSPTAGIYRPKLLRELGWGTRLDGSNCTMASAAMALDRHTEGAKTATPPEMRACQDDQVGGTDLNDAAVAWSRCYSETLDVDSGISWSTFRSKLNAGRGAILQGMYSKISNTFSCQPSFNGGHAMYVNEQRSDGDYLVYDPLCYSPRWIPESMLRDYAESLTGVNNVFAGFTRITT
jgi:hypothetical protein